MIAPKLAAWLGSAAILVAPAEVLAQAAGSPQQIAEEAAARAEEAAAAAVKAAAAARAAANALHAAAAPAAAGHPASTSGESLIEGGSLRAAIQAKEQKLFAETVDNGTDGTNLNASRIPDFQILATEDDKVAKVALTFDFANHSGTPGLTTDQLTLSASTTLDDGQTDASLVGLKGFQNGTSLELSFIHYSGRTNLTGIEQAAVAAARDECEKGLGRGAAACDPYAYATGAGSFVAKYSPGGYEAMLDAVRPGPVAFTGLRVSGNQAAYKYLDRPSFGIEKESHFGFSAGAFGGLLLNHGMTSVTGEFTYKRAYDAQDPVELCQPLSGTIQTQCLTGADGRPERSKEAIFSAELRHAFKAKVGTFSKLAIAPEVSADVENDAWSVSLPVYFAGDGKGSLRAGVRGVYVNTKDKVNGGRDEDFTIGVFFGVPFSVLQSN
ncbi:hypothetical protein [Phenylobacterium sp.]|uniref:hypothetical protein n=1 Tax=Phenylobacterium sp. TaxID=1871053 RepID=UPI003D267D98